jgi:multiple sugar transport system substrate-binding protein
VKETRKVIENKLTMAGDEHGGNVMMMNARWRMPVTVRSGQRMTKLKAAVVMTAALVASVAACGTSTLAAGTKLPFAGKTVSVFTNGPSGANSAATSAYYKYFEKLFHAKTGASVNWVYYTSSSQESSTVEASVATSTGPDIFAVGSGFNGTIYGTHAFHALSASNWKALGGRSSFSPSMLAMAGPSATKDIGVPYESQPFILAYNKAEFAKAGIKAPPTTWAQFVADAQAVMKANPGTYGDSLDPADAYGPWKEVWSYALQSGGNLVSANGKKSTLDSAPVRAALQFYLSEEYKYHIVPPQCLTWTGTEQEAAFAKGQVAMITDATYSLLAEVQGTPVGKEIAFAPMPDVPLGSAKRPAGAPAAQSIVSGNYWTIASWDKNIPLALAFIKVGTSPQMQAEQFKLLGENPVTNVALTQLAKSTPAMKPFITAQANSTPLPFTAAWSYIEEGVLAAVSHSAQQLATSGSLSASYVSSQLKAADAAVQPQLSKG